MEQHPSFPNALERGAATLPVIPEWFYRESRGSVVIASASEAISDF